MIDLNELQILSQIIDNIEISIKNMEKSYKDKNSEFFEKSKKEILNNHEKIKRIIK